MSAPDVAKFEEENARLGVALGDAYAVLAKTKTALEQVQAEYDALKHELDWFKRQLFGQKSEKRLDIDDEAQLNLLAGLGVEKPPSRDDVPTQTVTYERRAKVRDAAVAESGLRFGPEVPVQTIEVTDPAIETIPQAEREVIGEKVSYRLAQQPGSYVVGKASTGSASTRSPACFPRRAAPSKPSARTTALPSSPIRRVRRTVAHIGSADFPTSNGSSSASSSRERTASRPNPMRNPSSAASGR